MCIRDRKNSAQWHETVIGEQAYAFVSTCFVCLCACIWCVCVCVLCVHTHPHTPSHPPIRTHMQAPTYYAQSRFAYTDTLQHSRSVLRCIECLSFSLSLCVFVSGFFCVRVCVVGVANPLRTHMHITHTHTHTQAHTDTQTHSHTLIYILTYALPSVH